MGGLEPVKENLTSMGFLSKNGVSDHSIRGGSDRSNNTTRSIENIVNAPVHRRKLNNSNSLRRSDNSENGTSSGVSSMMPRSASISNFSNKTPGKLEFSGGVQTNTAGMNITKRPGSGVNSSENLTKLSKGSSMPKLTRTDSFPRRNNINSVKIENLPPPDDHSRISGVITALPASSSYYNISASKARLIDKSSENNKQENNNII